METKGMNRPGRLNGHVDVPRETTGDNAFLPSAPDSEVSEYHFESDGFRQRCPRLYTLLAKQVVNGKRRETASVRLFADGGRLKAAIHDKHTGQTFWTTLDGSVDPCVELEAALASGKGEWRKDRQK